MEIAGNYLQKKNNDDVYLRSMILSVLKYLTDKIYITNTVNNETTSTNIPFYYNNGGDERFMQDMFVNDLYNDLIEDKKIQGNYDEIPRGIVTLSTISINTSNMTSRFVRGTRTKLNSETGELEVLKSNVNILPLKINFEVEIRYSTKIDGFKLWQKLVSTFYKVGTTEFEYEGEYINIKLGFPEDDGMENTFTFSFGDSIENKMTLSIECAANYSIYDEFFNSNNETTIERFDVYYSDTIKTINQPKSPSLSKTNIQSIDGSSNVKRVSDLIIDNLNK